MQATAHKPLVRAESSPKTSENGNNGRMNGHADSADTSSSVHDRSRSRKHAIVPQPPHTRSQTANVPSTEALSISASSSTSQSQSSTPTAAGSGASSWFRAFASNLLSTIVSLADDDEPLSPVNKRAPSPPLSSTSSLQRAHSVTESPRPMLQRHTSLPKHSRQSSIADTDADALSTDGDMEIDMIAIPPPQSQPPLAVSLTPQEAFRSIPPPMIRAHSTQMYHSSHHTQSQSAMLMKRTHSADSIEDEERTPYTYSYVNKDELRSTTHSVDALPTPSSHAAQSAQSITSMPETVSVTRSFTQSATNGMNGHMTDTAAGTMTPRTLEVARSVRLNHFNRVLSADEIDMAALRRLSWSGIPSSVRALVWKLLLNYLPMHRQRWDHTLNKRRLDYQSYVAQHYDVDTASANSRSQSSAALLLPNETLHQIQQDVPRTSPAVLAFKLPEVQKSLERLLYTFAIRHPATGYVQGMNDLATPFYSVFYADMTGYSLIYDNNNNNNNNNNNTRSTEGGTRWLLKDEESVLNLECDVYWCMSALIDSIQDHYTFAQPGIQLLVYRFQQLHSLVDPELCKHLEENKVDFMLFAFRWINCLLMREMSLSNTIRLWDTYFAIDQQSAAVTAVSNVHHPSSSSSISTVTATDHRKGFAYFHIYVCSALLQEYSLQLKSMDFQDIMMFLQKLPTDQWDYSHVETLIAQAYVYQNQYGKRLSQLR